MYTPAPTRLSLSPGTPQKPPGATWPQGRPIACIVISLSSHIISLSALSVAPPRRRGYDSSERTSILFHFFSNCCTRENVNEIINWKSNVEEQSRLDREWKMYLIVKRQQPIVRKECNDRYIDYMQYIQIYVCIYIRNVNWSSKTWSTCTRGSFCFNFSILDGSRTASLDTFLFLWLRFCLLRPGISHIVRIYPSLPYLSFYLLCSLLSHSIRRFVSFALYLFAHNVRLRFSSRCVGSIMDRCYSEFLSLSCVPRALVSGNGDAWLCISYVFSYLLSSYIRTFVLIYLFLSFSLSLPFLFS